MSIARQQAKLNDKNSFHNRNNSLTMQKALETAYDDWNKNKSELLVSNEEGYKEGKSEILSENVDSIVQVTSPLPPPHLTTTPPISYYFGNPLVDLVKGIMHIYKDNNLTALNDDSIRSEMLCMLGIPHVLTCNELINFVLPYR